MSVAQSHGVVSATFRVATPEDAHLPTYDNTKLTALATCPTWGIITYQMHKRMTGAGRAMALEAGSAMHECFAFVRLVTLHHQLLQAGEPGLAEQAWWWHGARIFGDTRFVEINAAAISGGADPGDIARYGSIATLNTGAYYDDPRDRRRTLSNLEECILAYVNRWRWDQPVWMRDHDNPTGDVGIEIPFDIVCALVSDRHPTKHIRLTGKIDGIHVHAGGVITLHENKTASRLNDAWVQSFALASQVTQYCVAASVFTKESVRRADVLGLAIPLPKTYEFGGFVRESVRREDYHFRRWLAWLLHIVDLAEQYQDNPFDAPKYTHSCNRYFRPCSLIPFCDAEDSEQRDMLNEFEHHEWSPLHKETID